MTLDKKNSTENTCMPTPVVQPGDFEDLIEPASPPSAEEQSFAGVVTPPVAQSISVDNPLPEDTGSMSTSTNNEPVGDGAKHLPRLVLAIASGKGGVGKSLITASIGIYLAQLGKRVIVVDADLGSSNLHTLLGVEQPKLSLHDLLCEEVKRIEEIVVQTPFRGLGLIPSHDNAIGATNPRPAQKGRLLSQIRTLAVDYVIIDLASSPDYNTLDLFLSADLHIVVAAPEPTSIESAFRLIKSAFIRKLKSLKGFNQLLSDLQNSAHGGIPTPNQLYQMGRERNPEMGEAIHHAMTEFKPRLVVNMTRTRDDLELGPALAAVGRRHFTLPFDYLGYVENEDVAWVTVRKRRPLLVEYPESKVAKDIERVTRRILSLENKEHPDCTRVPLYLDQQGHYEILGLHPGASDEEVRRAQRRVRRIYSPESIAIYGIVPPAEVIKMHNRIEEAYSTLADPEKRHLYDQRVLPGGHTLTPASEDDDSPISLRSSNMLEHSEVSVLGERPEMPSISERTVYSGGLLRQIREAKGFELQDVAERTKITLAYLRAIEEENFMATPPPVYLRGFIKIVAKDLKLDPEQVARTYMERYFTVNKSNIELK